VPESKPAKAETPFERFKKFTEKVMSVPRSEIQKREEEWKRGAKSRKHR
jgi:hypothetical protein